MLADDDIIEASGTGKCERCPRNTAQPTPLMRLNYALRYLRANGTSPSGTVLEVRWLCTNCALMEDDVI